MDQEHQEVTYKQFFQKPFKERLNIFNEITADNRALLVKTHAERWLAANRSRLANEQINAVEDLMVALSPKWYETDRDFEKLEPEIEVLIKKIEALLSREDCQQLASNRSEYIPTADDGNH